VSRSCARPPVSAGQINTSHVIDPRGSPSRPAPVGLFRLRRPPWHLWLIASWNQSPDPALPWHLTGISRRVRPSLDRGVRGPPKSTAPRSPCGVADERLADQPQFHTGGHIRNPAGSGDCGSLLADGARADLSAYRRSVPLRPPVQLDHTAPASVPAGHASGIRRLTFAARITVTARCAA